jgi:RNA polymerase sigma-70 factor (ECF subfamily)
LRFFIKPQKVSVVKLKTIFISTEKKIVKLLGNPQTKEKAYNFIVEDFQQALYWHIRKMVGDHDDAHDVLQNTFIKVWKSLDGFRGDSKVYTWLYRIATNEALSFLRSKKQHEPNAQAHLWQASADPYFDGSAAEETLWQAIHQLPEKQKAVFIMKYFDDLPYEDIASITGTSVGALKASYHHASQKIKDFVQHKTHYLP